MKKVFLGMLAAALVLSVGVTGTFAAGAGVGKGCRARNTAYVCGYVSSACRHVDADGDGICDQCQTACADLGRYYIDADGDGVCDNAGSGYRHVDADGDGICDQCQAACIGLGRYYTDADGDGVCDNAGSGVGHHGGQGNGYRGGHHR